MCNVRNNGVKPRYLSCSLVQFSSWEDRRGSLERSISQPLERHTEFFTLSLRKEKMFVGTKYWHDTSRLNFYLGVLWVLGHKSGLPSTSNSASSIVFGWQYTNIFDTLLSDFQCLSAFQNHEIGNLFYFTFRPISSMKSGNSRLICSYTRWDKQIGVSPPLSAGLSQ